MSVQENASEQLAWEERRRPRVAAAALAAAVLTVAASLWSALAFKDAPRSGFIPALLDAEKPGPIGSSPSPRLAYYEFFHAHAAEVISTAVLRGLALVGIGILLSFMAAATRARSPQLPRFVAAMSMIGALLSALATVLTAVATLIAVNHFLDGPRTVTAAEELGKGTLLVTAQLIGLPGTLALALCFVLVCLNAMRAGLLTRFMGILGIIVGVLLIFPIGSPIPVVQIFWLLALGLLLLGRVRAVPPAWKSGRAEPWPSQLERRMGQGQQQPARPQRGQREAPAGEESDAPNGGTLSPAASKKKRKRRR